MSLIDISIVVPVYNERDSIAPLLCEITMAMAAIGRPYEIIAVDDGSTDGSGALLNHLCQTNSRLRLISFRRNYGQAAAFDAGFCRASGAIVVTLDADGQNDPADIPRMVGHFEANELDFLSGCRSERKDHAILRKLPSRIANLLIRKVTRTHIRDLGCSLKIYKSTVVKEVRLYGEMHRFLAVLIEGTGAKIGQIDVNHRPRTAGQSKYGLSRTFKVLLDLVTIWFMRGFQTSPIYAFGGFSLCLMTSALGLSAVVLAQKFVNGVFVHRNPLFILSMVMAIMAVQFMAMGLIAELNIRTYFEARGKPAYLISREVGFELPKLEMTLFTSPRSAVALEAL